MEGFLISPRGSKRHTKEESEEASENRFTLTVQPRTNISWTLISGRRGRSYWSRKMRSNPSTRREHLFACWFWLYSVEFVAIPWRKLHKETATHSLPIAHTPAKSLRFGCTRERPSRSLLTTSITLFPDALSRIDQPLYLGFPSFPGQGRVR